MARRVHLYSSCDLTADHPQKLRPMAMFTIRKSQATVKLCFHGARLASDGRWRKTDKPLISRAHDQPAGVTGDAMLSSWPAETLLSLRHRPQYQSSMPLCRVPASFHPHCCCPAGTDPGIRAACLAAECQPPSTLTAAVLQAQTPGSEQHASLQSASLLPPSLLRGTLPKRGRRAVPLKCPLSLSFSQEIAVPMCGVVEVDLRRDGVLSDFESEGRTQRTGSRQLVSIEPICSFDVGLSFFNSSKVSPPPSNSLSQRFPLKIAVVHCCGLPFCHRQY
ncbi:uncharacterized protein LOC118217807 [Anguilla anguilla]|uniref:uncharacterized protein LOC118217807 n=1 Tax=Anguilla anguilla TaxID=7936 RepID=UPI0015AAC3C8|nr:uncharacterized protein LOC118217807 [Anguilla anguilla]